MYLYELFKQLICKIKTYTSIPGIPVCVIGGTRHEDPVMNGLLKEMNSLSARVLDAIQPETNITHKLAPGRDFVGIYVSVDGSNRQLDMDMADGSRFVFNK
jgi:hypothetical protein